MSGSFDRDRPYTQTWTSREFDYGVGDDLDAALREVRSQIADQIRQAASSASSPTGAEQLAYEQAARIAEHGGADSSRT